MKYSQITVHTTSEASELVAYFMQEVSVDGVCIYDKNDLYSNSSWDYADDSVMTNYADDEVLVKGYCQVENTESVLAFLRSSFANLDQSAGSLKTEVDQVDGDLWIANWKKNFQPIEIGNLIICPEWIDCDADSKKLLKLETGISFGTGQHETTSMCLELMQKIDLEGKTTLDVGCGSGILGLSSLLLGAKRSHLVDNDVQAVEVAKSNALLNGLTDCNIVCGNLTDSVTEKSDVVLANLTADILYLLAEDICRCIKTGGKAVLSGILADRVDKVEKCYAEKGFAVVDKLGKGEWSALLLEYRKNV